MFINLKIFYSYIIHCSYQVVEEANRREGTGGMVFKEGYFKPK